MKTGEQRIAVVASYPFTGSVWSVAPPSAQAERPARSREHPWLLHWPSHPTSQTRPARLRSDLGPLVAREWRQLRDCWGSFLGGGASSDPVNRSTHPSHSDSAFVVMSERCLALFWGYSPRLRTMTLSLRCGLPRGCLSTQTWFPRPLKDTLHRPPQPAPETRCTGKPGPVHTLGAIRPDQDRVR